MEKLIKFLKIFFGQKELEFVIEKPFAICATSFFLGIAIIEWGLFILFCFLLLFVFALVIMIPLTVIVDGKIPSYSIPYSMIFWSLFLWLSFFVVSWFLLGRNFPKSVSIDSNGANIQYPIKLFNKKIPIEQLDISRSIYYGISGITIKRKGKLRGIWLNAFLYRNM